MGYICMHTGCTHRVLGAAQVTSCRTRDGRMRQAGVREKRVCALGKDGKKRVW